MIFKRNVTITNWLGARGNRPSLPTDVYEVMVKWDNGLAFWFLFFSERNLRREDELLSKEAMRHGPRNDCPLFSRRTLNSRMGGLRF